MHTPGPWTLPTVTCPDHVYDSTGNVRICALEDRPWQEQDANARLIAAAPDLLAALQTLEALSAEAELWLSNATQARSTITDHIDGKHIRQVADLLSQIRNANKTARAAIHTATH